MGYSTSKMAGNMSMLSNKDTFEHHDLTTCGTNFCLHMNFYDPIRQQK